ncbi:hypothetical protein H310_06590 [Aphanomyces invadans]|uniref:BCNT-C domain-containing protein n=1 Tax=Aphanomyces invadans TaxID=157072 RepID=A0A024U3G5_9STRA|nr:hypothetical protein H310_06590 [Aphanomyces invadans]ETW00936.1 hypothetical protein H310_06590 [Aphanomyces invadans]|eukprot:XP_008869934.1 hypothetical protein H310_06590 [Aphanomyces invadans]
MADKSTLKGVPDDAASSEDDDYDPEADVEGQLEDALDAKDEAEYERQQLSKKGSATQVEIAGKRKVDDLWGELQAATSVSTKASTKSQQLLNKLLGGTSSKKKKQKVYEFKVPVLGCTPTSALTSPTDLPTTTAAPAVTTQVLKYAGEEYSVTKSAATGPRASGLDAALASINQPKKVSTIEKSSLDWDSYKDKAGIADELTHYTKDGYASLETESLVGLTRWRLGTWRSRTFCTAWMRASLSWKKQIATSSAS